MAQITIKTLLLDADGVVQRTAPGWREQIAALCGDPQRADDFVADVFAAEKPCLLGHRDFAQALGEVLQRWHSPATLAEALDVWTLIEPDTDMLARVAQLSLPVCLATNQQSLRARFMTESLGYREHFAALFYSCELGVSKPDPNYFHSIANRLALPAQQLLFIDDHAGNVAAARSAGLHAEQFHVDEGTTRLDTLLARYGITI